MADGVNAWDFFIAHAGNDARNAAALYDLLARASRVFLDSKCLKLGDDWDAALAEAQRQSRITVVLVTASTEEAYYQREEIASAISMARDDPDHHRVVPIYLNGATPTTANIPYGLRLKHGIIAGPNKTLSDVALELLALLEQLTPLPSASGHGSEPAHLSRPDDSHAELTNESVLSQSDTSRIIRGYHPVHGMVLVKDLLAVPEESVDLILSRHYRSLLGPRLIEIGRRTDGQLYEILKEIPGFDLWSVVQKKNVIVGALLDDIALQVIEQLAVAHSASWPIIHRDVRPTNLILTFENIDHPAVSGSSAQAVRYRAKVRLIDYDTACFDRDSQTPWGTHGFTAPEQRNGHATPASDLFSLLSSLYFLATGSNPPDAGTWANRQPPPFESLFEADFTALSERHGHDALLQCWSYDPADRPESAPAFLEKQRRSGTRLYTRPRHLGTLTVGGKWQVQMFDSEYTVTTTTT